MDVRKFSRAALCGLFAASVAGVAMGAADPYVGVEVVRQIDSVTNSRSGGGKKGALDLATQAAYKVTFTNGATNTLNRVFLTGALQNKTGTDLPTFALAYWENSSLSPTTLKCSGFTTAQLSCSLPSLPPGSSQSFYVVVNAPKDGSEIYDTWTGGGYEGNGGGNGCCQKSLDPTPKVQLIDPANDPDIDKKAQSFVSPSGGSRKIFTGNQALASSTDGWTTLVAVPNYVSASQAVVTIDEQNPDAGGSSCSPISPNFSCPSTGLSIRQTIDPLSPRVTFGAPDSNGVPQYLEITITWDKSKFNLGTTKPETLTLKYYKDELSAPVDVMLCGTSSPTATNPCMPTAPVLLKGGSGVPPDQIGNLQFKVWAVENGKYSP